MSANLGRRDVAGAWAREVIGRTGGEAVDLVFLQEVPFSEDWALVCNDAGFGLSADPDSTYVVRSLLLWRKDAVDGEQLTLPTAPYHGSYLAAAVLTLPRIGDTVAVSVHASPAVVDAQHRERWLQMERPLPGPRPSAGPEELWDSDFVLATLAELARERRVLAAGDFNECLAWDDSHPGEWGKEYFARVAESGLTSLTHRDDGVEVRSAFTHDGLEYQLDHVLASQGVGNRIDRPPYVDSSWSRERVLAGETSDHAPLWFEIG